MRCLLCLSILLGLSGCHAYTLDVDGHIAERASLPIDVQPASKDEPAAPKSNRVGRPGMNADLVLIEAEQPAKEKLGPKTLLERLTPSDELLGVKVPDIKLLPGNASPAEREAAIKKQFPPLAAIPKLPEPRAGPDGRPLTLSDLQQIALRTSPVIRQAHLDVEASRGQTLQAGLYPNPTIGYQAESINQGRTPGLQGGFINQTIKTGGKLSLARAASLADVSIHEQKLRQAEADVQAQVRAGYFALLSAQKNYDTTKALVQLTDELYNVLLQQMAVGEVATYEPMQIRVLALQARGSLVQVHNRYVSAWKQLAATLGTPGLSLTAVAGRIDMPVPHYEHEQVLEYVLSNHSEVVAAQLGVDKARVLTRLAEVQPFPDVNVNLVIQKDFTTPPYGKTASVSVGVPFPLWDRNQGNIHSARAQSRKAMEDDQRVRNELTRKVAEAFERYDNNRSLLKMYKEQILPNQVQAFRAAVARHAAIGDKGVSYNDLVTSQQTLANLITTYLGVLSDQWTSVVDIGNLLQTNDLFQTRQLDEVAPIPDVPEIINHGRRRK